MLRAIARAQFLVSTVALSALLLAAPGSAAPVARPDPEKTASVYLRLKANNGLRAKLESADGGLTLEISRKGRLVSYQVEGEVSEAGVTARFGRLGLIDVAFEPTRTVSTTGPPKRCSGEPWVRREGFFTGTIDFTGELGYVRIEASRARGSTRVTSEWICPGRPGPDRVPGIRPLSTLGAQESSERKEYATLSALSRRCRCGFGAYGIRHPSGRGRSIFIGSRSEVREGMEIGRATFVYAGASRFVFDHAAGTAAVRPPPPFAGGALFRRRPHGRALWSGTILVPLLGAAPLAVQGRRFQTTLRRDFPGD